MQKVKSGMFMVFAMLVMVAVMPSQVLAEDGALLYLVEFKANEAGIPMTREQAIELLGNVIVPSLNRLAKDDAIQAGGVMVGARAGAFVVRANSHDEVTAMVRKLPAWGVWEWQVTPLESFGHRATLESRIVQELRAQQ